MKINKIFLTSAVLLMCTSCNDWLDVKPDNQVPEKEMFKSTKGFEDALNGCYMTMADRDVYGEKLTMSNIESLAAQWNLTSYDYRADDYYFLHHKYEEDACRNSVKKMYGKLFNVVTQVNVLLKACETNGANISNPAIRATIEGEAHAMRAFCQMDILRIFGQIPQNATIEVKLPYSEINDISSMPSYYSFKDYVSKLEEDLDKAEALLKDNDLIFKYTFGQLNDPSTLALDDDYFAYRQFHFNYWGVKAMKARLYSYIGENRKAHDIAMEIINAKGADGDKLIKLSGSEDLRKGFYALPSECLLALHKYNLKDYSPDVLGGDAGRKMNPGAQLCLNGTWNLQTRLFEGQDIASHNRYIYQWEQNTQSSVNGQKFPTIKKYYSGNTGNVLSDMTKVQVIPLLRLSEMYLIAMEHTDDLHEANALYKEYMASHDVSVEADNFASLDEVKAFILPEYRREFYAEGVMFYQYKRRNIPNMLFQFGETMTENLYIIPLPETEYDPAGINKDE